MEKPQSIRNVRLHWESKNTAYQYTLESSTDGNDWSILADHSKNKEPNGLSVDAVKADDARYLKITFRGSNGGGWGSIWEIEAYPGDLPPLPEGVTAGADGAASIDDVKAPEGFEVSLFAGPPQVTYPVVVRIRPDGTEMEVYSWGQRNIVDIAIDPFMNVFTRDNTNDGGGWDIRLSHVMQTANYGYPSLYMNFADEIMPPLADYGGGSGCGALYFQDDRWPAPYNDMLLTCDWGRSEVFSHRLPRNGATFDAQQDTFLKIPRPTDADADASGRLFVTSWKNGNFAFERPDVGFVAMITPSNFVAHPVSVPSASGWAIANDRTASINSRVAALWTLRQTNRDAFKSAFGVLLIDPDLREHAIRAAADRKSQIDKALSSPIFSKLDDSNPRVRAAAIMAMGRISRSMPSSN